MNAHINELTEQISRLTKKTEKRLDGFEVKLKEVEANTFWKIKDYEKLLEARPTMQYVKSAVQDECRQTLLKGRAYTDEEIQLLKDGEGALVKQFEAFKTQTIISLGEAEQKIRDFDQLSLHREAESRRYADDKERNILMKFDEFNLKMDKM